MKKHLGLLVALVMMMGLSGCFKKSFETVDGNLPASFVPQATILSGEYKGRVGFDAIDMRLQLNGNHVEFTSTQDYLGTGCQSKIGNLKRVLFTEKKGMPKVKGFVFAYDPNQCSNSVLGREMFADVYYNKSGEAVLNLSVYMRTDWEYYCTHAFTHNGGPLQNCYWRAVPKYINGRVYKKMGLGELDKIIDYLIEDQKDEE